MINPANLGEASMLSGESTPRTKTVRVFMTPLMSRHRRPSISWLLIYMKGRMTPLGLLSFKIGGPIKYEMSGFPLGLLLNEGGMGQAPLKNAHPVCSLQNSDCLTENGKPPGKQALI